MSGYFEVSSDQVLSITRGRNEALGDDHPRVVTLIVVDHNNRAPPGGSDPGHSTTNRKRRTRGAIHAG